MKALPLILLLALVLAGCRTADSHDSLPDPPSLVSLDEDSSPERDLEEDRAKAALDAVIHRFEEEMGEPVLWEKPEAFHTLGAVDGVLFYWDEEPVKLFVYASREDYETATESVLYLQELPHRDLVVLDTASARALELFERLE